MTGELAAPALHWERRDFERRLGFKGAKYTGTNPALTFSLGALLTLAFLVALVPFMRTYVGELFFARSSLWVQWTIAFLTSWSLAILFVKWRKLSLQAEALRFSMAPAEADYVLSPLTADDILTRIRDLADDPSRFLLLNRIERCLSNLKNLGRVADVDDILRSQADNDENYTEATYTLVRGFVWAIPVFGFIGTVVGLSQAIGGFGEVLAKGADLAQLRESLQSVTGGLAVAFETTLIGLVAAVGIQLLLTAVKKKEEDFLDECREYCHRHIVSRLRIAPMAEGPAEGAR
ncbi:MAG TPA: MotA/TolQ/ExbB proton channel family protein [Candidatus Brocadiia bacterium]|nr:MotA/TolQ/ExbB proton channel family protein [Candidatus Brocadiia bacterium]